MIFPLLYLVITLTHQVTGTAQKITFYDGRGGQDHAFGVNFWHYYEDECVNLEPDWVNRASSFETDGLCVTLYTRNGCKGESKNFYTLTRANKFLADFDFDKKTASFKKCNSDVEILSNLRPIFYVEADAPLVIPPIRSGECRTLPKFEDGRDFYGTDQHCYILHDKADCAGDKRYYIHLSRENDGLDKSYTLHYDRLDFKSFQMCELIFHPPCDPICPKFLYNGSLEYNYWTQFFSISSTAHRKEFEERVKQSDNGFILWDFLFPTETSSPSLGYQYLDALINLWNVFRALEMSRPGTLGFNETNLEGLLLLSARLRLERTDQKYSIKRNTTDQNFVILSYLEDYWERMEDLLDGIIQRWYPTIKNSDINLPKIKFWKGFSQSGTSIEYTLRSKCVNLHPYWTRTAISISPFDQCATVYSNANCKGDSENFHSQSRGLNFMGELNFDSRVASFKKCSSKVQVKVGVRPQFYVPVFDHDDRNEVLKIFSGSCLTLPKRWLGRANYIRGVDRCYTVFDDVNCEGNKSYAVFTNGDWYSVDRMKSLKICNLIFVGKCEFPPCPKFLYNGSAEYDFWMYLFSITSRSNRNQFDARVKRSNDGFISWDFLFVTGKNSTARSSENNLYRDALNSQSDILRSLFALSRPGKLSFNETSLETLLLLASRVHEERSRQKGNFRENQSDPNFNTMLYLVDMWGTIESILDKIIQKWYPKHSDGKLPEVKFWKNSQHTGDSITYAYEEKCVNLRPYWINKAKSITTNGLCVTVYTMINCKGDSKNFVPLSSNSAGDFNFNEVASFKKCEPIQLGDKLVDRPKFEITVIEDKAEETFTVLSGECRLLPEIWHRRNITVRLSTQQCYAFFQDTACTGNANSYHVQGMEWYRTFYQIKSVRTCGLEFNAPCHSSCPRFLRDGSPEYAFWLHFFTVFSPTRRGPFEERVKRSKDGFISWDFFLASKAPAPYQYEDVLEILLASLSNTRTLSFEKSYLEKMLVLISDVHRERDEQRLQSIRNGVGDYDIHDFVILVQLNDFWRTLEKLLDEFIQKWYPKNMSGKEKKVTFWDFARNRGDSVTYTVERKCVNLRPYWVNRTSSLNVGDQCITAYSKTDCKGDSRNIYPRSRGHQHMGEINFDDAIVSFRKCAPNLQVKMNARPTFHFVFYTYSGYIGVDISQVFSIKSNQCLTLPENWHKTAQSAATDEQCYNFFEGADCTGNKRYHLPGQTIYGNDLIVSVKLCDLVFQPPCDQAACPKFLYAGSVEFNFWLHYFCVISRTYRDQFRERVARSKNGFISWDFLIASNSSALSLGYQYLDAVESQRAVLSVLRFSRPGRFGFNKENLETLFALSTQVFKERSEQRATLDINFKGHNFIVLWQMVKLWDSIQTGLNETIEHWRNENSDDFCGMIGSKEYENLDQTVPNINEGSLAVYGDDPWHVALYRLGSKNRDPILICGGSLISASVVLSAAHCFYDRGRKKLQTNASLYEVYAGKLKRDYDAADDDGEFKEKHKIEEIIYHFNKYDPETTGTYGSDIVLIVLDEPVTLNQYVHPVCLDWDNSIFGPNSNNLTTGRVSGWGSTNTDSEYPNYSEELLTTELKYISRDNCVGKLKHLSIDNFCGGAEKGPGTRKGDSGGGFVFLFKNRFYIRGIVSSNDRDSKSSISAFTDVSSYISWIQNYI